ncbi:MAG: glycosyltransferase [Candidatus Latescibacterota bacterium]
MLLIGEVLEDPRVLKTCRSLRGAGAEVTVACTAPSGKPPREIFQGLRIVRFPHRRDSFLKRGYLWFQGRMKTGLGRTFAQVHEEVPQSRLLSSLRNLALALNHRVFMGENRRINRMMVRAFSGERFDFIHANDMDTLTAGCALKRAGAARQLLYDSHEYWPGIGVHGSAATDAIRRLEAAGIAEADQVMTVNPFIAEMLQREYGLNRRPAVLLNCPYRDEEAVETGAVHQPVRVLYQGKVQAFRGIEQLVLAFHHIEGAELTISGDGPLLARFRLLAVSEGLADRVRFTGRFEPEETLSLVRRHDIGVLPFSPVTLSITYSSPNKLFDYAMGGLAVVATDLPYLRKVIEEHRMGVLFPKNDPACIAEALQALIDETERLKEYRRNARKAALEQFSWEEQFAANYPFL